VVYLGAVHPGEDEYRALTDLLFGARERYRSVRATVRHCRRGVLATEAINRYVEYGFRNNILSNFDPPYDEPRYREYGDLEEVSRLWHERPDRWRQETDPSDGSGTAYRVADGKGPWWAYSPPDRALYSPTNEPREFSPDRGLSGLLDPYELRHNELNYRVLGTGRRTLEPGSAMGVRETVEVEAEAVSWNYAPLEPFEDGADDYALSVDAEIGIILRLASRLGGEEYDLFEVSDIAFDEVFAEGTFRLELPGVEVRAVEDS
jgi:outer membrane lipoprotein-sorting protein